ncbi:hybrid-cluster NAD(P)-dependent oxidoreductase [Nocardioides aurantiacus]|uniref:Ferredoxin-NADP reductase n=1 Tax=Nocardioides aurantiacus TaxID=86796 RepID=A0A3N2CUE2_9ACTN|nr:hybrid-cluster NAD(P)-dependent oxidoreductase [Nocardioides aurantiacus]ROR90834.1 ferredoxin-NADP reductase [Nocardioides aurantiacus]
MTATISRPETGSGTAGPLLCTCVVDVTHDVRSFVLRPAVPAAYDFEPGQHLTLTVPVAGEPLSRCYTISSSPRRAEELTITVKRVPGGPVSNWLHDHLRVGDSVLADGPLGRFSTTHHPAARYLFLTAGSGITPLMSMLRTVHADRADVDVVLVHHARTPADIVFREELRTIEAEHPGVRVVVVCETDAADETWTGPRGRVCLEQLRAAAPDLAEREVLTCGPAPYMAAVRDLLAEAGADPARCHEESFSFADAPAPVAGTSTGTTYAVELRRSGRSFRCGEGTPLLSAAAAAGITLPSSCQEGVCGTCTTQVLSGRVEMEHQGGIRPREVAQGKTLLCCSTPCEDVVLDA